MTVFNLRLDVDRWIAQARIRPQVFVHEFIQDITKEQVQATPVDTGTLRANWFPDYGPSAQEPTTRTDPSGVEAIANVSAFLRGFRVGQTFYFLNNTSYAKFVEFGTERMAPRAYVRGTVAQASAIAARTAARIRARKGV